MPLSDAISVVPFLGQFLGIRWDSKRNHKIRGRVEHTGQPTVPPCGPISHIISFWDQTYGTCMGGTFYHSSQKDISKKAITCVGSCRGDLCIWLHATIPAVLTWRGNVFNQRVKWSISTKQDLFYFETVTRSLSNLSVYVGLQPRHILPFNTPTIWSCCDLQFPIRQSLYFVQLIV